MSIFREYICAVLASLLAVLALPAGAQQVTCKNNPMRERQFCSSGSVGPVNGRYFFGTDDAGERGLTVVSFGGLAGSSRPDGAMLKIDSAAPKKMAASGGRPDVHCSRYGGCTWSVYITIEFGQEDLSALAQASTVLVSFTEGAYVSDPVAIDPQRIVRWYSEWRALSQPQTVGAAKP